MESYAMEGELKKRSIKHFVHGFAGAFDLFGNNGGRISISDLQDGPAKDAQALRGDWEAVGSDIHRAMDRVKHELAES